jgi:hypothetical protein
MAEQGPSNQEHGPQECIPQLGLLGRLAGQTVELIVHPLSVHWSRFHFGFVAGAGCPLINPKGEAREGSSDLGKTCSSLPPCTMPGIPSSRSRLGSRWARTLVYHLGRGFDLPAAKRHHSSRAWPPGAKGRHVLDLNSHDPDQGVIQVFLKASFPWRVGRGHIPGGLV